MPTIHFTPIACPFCKGEGYTKKRSGGPRTTNPNTGRETRIFYAECRACGQHYRVREIRKLSDPAQFPSE